MSHYIMGLIFINVTPKVRYTGVLKIMQWSNILHTEY